MDLNDDLCRPNFYDFISPKLEPGSAGLTPVAFIDSVDYINSLVTDTNNNLDDTGTHGSNGASNHMKSFLDEMLFDTNGSITLNSHGTTNSSPSTNGSSDEIEPVGLPSINSTFELMGSFQWSSLSNGNGTDSNSDTSSTNNNGNNWLNSSDNEVTTLTNLLDPLFVSYDNEDINSLNCGLSSSTSLTNPNTLVSSDQISTTTFHADDSKAYLSSPETIILNGGDHEISWHKQNSPNSPFIYCDESLLRNVLQTGKLNGTILQSGNINLNSAVIKTNNGSDCATNLNSHNNNNNANNNGSITSMTELRKVLGYPPLSINSCSITTNSSPSPTSTSTTSPLPPASTLLDHHHHGSSAERQIAHQQSPFIEFKILDPMFQQVEAIVIDESNIPNVEELIMTRIDHNKNGANNKKLEIAERKINSTTLSTKWTYTNTPKTPKRRRTKNGMNNNNNNALANGTTMKPNETNGMVDTNNENALNPNSDSSRSPSNNGNNNGTSRKERSLHYCNICNKGFKDKYSVNVHVRTHTGEKPFGCFCGKHFRQKAHLAKHHQTHAAKANGHQKGKRAAS